MQQNTGNSMSQIEIQQCIQDCISCHDVCLQTATACEQSGGEHASPDHINILRDCAELCLVAAHFLQHNSALVGYVCQACAQATTHCGNECDRMGDTDCANACRNAAWACEQMTKMIA
jgi:hypothetical protein